VKREMGRLSTTRSESIAAVFRNYTVYLLHH
jgi:hypothetical protein